MKMKMFYQNPGHTFVLYYLIFVWVKFHVSIMRLATPRACQKVKNVSPKSIKIFPN